MDEVKEAKPQRKPSWMRPNAWLFAAGLVAFDIGLIALGQDPPSELHFLVAGSLSNALGTVLAPEPQPEPEPPSPEEAPVPMAAVRLWAETIGK